MKKEIERILNCDEAGRIILEKAQKESAKLINDAEKKVAAAKASVSKELEKFKEEEISKILIDAEQQAQQIKRDAKTYCSSLRDRFNKRVDEIRREIRILIDSSIIKEKT